MKNVLRKRILLFLCTLLFCIFLPAVLLCSHCFDRVLFHKITDAFVQSSLEHDALSLHFVMAYPDLHGVHLKDAALPVYSREASEASSASRQKFLSALSFLDSKKLNEEERYTYDLLCDRLTLDLEESDFPYYEEPLSPTSGMQSELLLLFAEYPFYTTDDVETYLSLLQSVPDYVQGLLCYESEKSEAGLFMEKEDAQKSAQQCREILTKDSLSSGTHFLQTTFSSRLATLSQNGLLTGAQQSQYESQNQSLLSKSVLPAWQSLADGLESLSDTGRTSGGLCQKPDGRQYYAWLVRESIGSSLSMDQLYQLLQKQFQKTYREMKQTLTAYQNLTNGTPDLTPVSDDFPLSDPTAILDDLQSRMQQDFPALSDLTGQTVRCDIQDVDAGLEAYSSPAFYMIPPLDALMQNTIRINRSSTSDGIELYTTLAHEGYPGHLYQTVYSSLSCDAQTLPVRKLFSYSGYVEGWAYYTERISYEYAAQVLADDSAALSTDAASSPTALLCELLAQQRDLQINLFCLLDLSLHYYGAEKPEILRSLESFGLSPEQSEHVYDYLRTAPAVYLKYYVGYLEMNALKKRAELQWGDSFSLLRFHRFVLEAGPSDFENLTKRLKQTPADDQPLAASTDTTMFFLYPES